MLERPAPSAGYDPAAIDVADDPGHGAGQRGGWQDVLARPDARRAPAARRVVAARVRLPRPRRVPPVRHAGSRLMLDEDDPLFANWDQDETAIAERYGSRTRPSWPPSWWRPADAVAASFAAVERRPVGAPGPAQRRRRFTVESFGRYFVHDSVHHLWDVGAAEPDAPAARTRHGAGTHRPCARPVARVSSSAVPPAPLTCSLCRHRSCAGRSAGAHPGNPVLPARSP